MKGQPLDLFGLHVSRRIVEVEDNVALVDLLHEKILATVGRHFVEASQLLKFSLALIGDIKSRGVLTLGSPNSFRHVFRGGLKTVEDVRFARRRQVSRHGLGSSGGRDVL